MRRNVLLCYALKATWNFLLVAAVMVPFFRQHDLSDTQIFWVQSLFALVLLVSDVPTGFLSDRLGRRTALVLAGIFKGLGGTALVFAHGFQGMVVSYALIGIANSLLSGTDVALLYDSHHEIQGEKPSTLVLQSRLHFMGIVSVAAAAVVGGVLAHRSMELAVQVNAAFAWLSLVIAFLVVEPPRRVAPASGARSARHGHLAQVSRVARHLVFASTELRWLSIATVIYGAAPVIATYAFQRLWADLAFPLASFGALAAVQSIAGGVAGLYAAKLGKRMSTRVTLALAAGLPLVAFLGASLHVAIVAIAAALVLEILRMMVQVVLVDRINGALSESRATANSILSFGGRTLLFAFGPVIGHFMEKHGIDGAFRFLLVFYALFGLVIGAALVWMRRTAPSEVPSAFHRAIATRIEPRIADDSPRPLIEETAPTT